MNQFDNQIIFKQLLGRHKRIQIPMIQRDYAQGRRTEGQVREEFLSALHDALVLPPGHESLPLNLDFIYGSVENDKEKRFLPLDGQQRLTTLFLLHWYLAWKDDKHDEFCAIFDHQGLSRFSYSVRPSSEEFFDALVRFSPDSSANNVPKPADLITDQPWYFRHWRLDPTIQASLTMLDAIHVHFCETEGCFSRLVDTEQPAITFQLLDLDNFGLSDDLYIKMNGRGIPLTTFEAFKARYEQVLEDQFGEKTWTLDNQSLPAAQFFARRMDTAWADFFWSHRDKKTNLYDESVMNLFRAVALVTRDPESNSYSKDISWLRHKWMKSTFSSFHNKKYLDETLANCLFLLLETWNDGEANFATQLPDKRFFDEFRLFIKAIREPLTLTSLEIVQFTAYVKFLQEHKENIDSVAFQKWMRMIFNLSVNTVYNRPEDVQRSIKGIVNLIPKSKNILQYFATAEEPVTGFYKPQIAEEKLKAALIRADNRWKPLIDQAESHGYFRGQIEFLLEFCGVAEKWKNSGTVNWENDVHSSFQEQFEIYLSKAESMFDDKGLVDLGKYRWQRALLSTGNYLLSSRQNKSFLVDSLTELTSWKQLFRGDSNARKLLHQLWDNLEIDTDIGSQLDALIRKSTALEPWREAFVNTPNAIEYCKKRFIRWNSEENIYLLSKTQMNGTHAELFTYCLYHNSLKHMQTNGDLEPLTLEPYQSMIGTDKEPCIRFMWPYDEHSINFDLERQQGHYIVSVGRDSLAQLPPDVDRVLRDLASFQENENVLKKIINPDDIETGLRELADVLTMISIQDRPRTEE